MRCSREWSGATSIAVVQHLDAYSGRAPGLQCQDTVGCRAWVTAVCGASEVHAYHGPLVAVLQVEIERNGFTVEPTPAKSETLAVPRSTVLSIESDETMQDGGVTIIVTGVIDMLE
jgi:hypothetical protein